jgi:hypothetical protein
MFIADKRKAASDLKSHFDNSKSSASDNSENMEPDPFEHVEPRDKIQGTTSVIKPSANQLGRSEIEFIDFYQDRLVDAKIRKQPQTRSEVGVFIIY